jgi:hypothetical protein
MRAYIYSILTLILSGGISAQHASIDYTDLSNWAYHPEIQTDLLHEYIEDSTWIQRADVFYLYPTFFLDKEDTNWNIAIDHPGQQELIVDKGVRFQASTWAESGRLFAPFYRQAHIRSYRNLEKGGKEALLFAYADVKNAFEHYLKHYNNGRPIILAGHSQGSTHLMLLLKEYFDEKPLSQQLVVAYLPGISIERDYYNELPLLKEPGLTNGYVVWNTFKRKVSEEKYTMWYKGSMCINPVTWDKTEVAKRKQHRGFLFWNNKMYRKRFSTHLIDGAVWISTPRFPYFFMSFKMDDYHLGDVNLFWQDIRDNSKLRLENWHQQK